MSKIDDITFGAIDKIVAGLVQMEKIDANGYKARALLVRSINEATKQAYAIGAADAGTKPTPPPPVADQPPPKPGSGDVWLLVLEDMLARRRLGVERYGTPVQAGNGRKALVDAYQESLDLAVYLRQEIEERKP